MREFIAKNPKQLNICLRMLYAENIQFLVRVRETHKKKIEFSVAVEVDEQTMAKLEEKYRIMIS